MEALAESSLLLPVGLIILYWWCLSLVVLHKIIRSLVQGKTDFEKAFKTPLARLYSLISSLFYWQTFILRFNLEHRFDAFDFILAVLTTILSLDLWLAKINDKWPGPISLLIFGRSN